MSTNTNFMPEDIAADLSGASQALAAGLPDPTVLARFANQIYQGLQQQGAASGVPAPNLPHTPEAALTNLPTHAAPPATYSPFGVAPHLSAAPAPPQLTDADLHKAAAEAAGISGTTIPTSSTQLPLPELNALGIPGGASAADFSAVPSFGFLSEARSLFEQAVSQSEQAVAPAIKLPTETEVRGFAPTLPGHSLTSIPATPLPNVSTPQIPGAPVPRGYDATSFPFLETARSLSSVSVAPVLEPVGNDPNLSPQSALSVGLFDVNAVRRDFPILQERVNGRPLIWLDNAATTQKPQAVIDRLKYFYEHENSNVHRAAHELAARSTDAYDAAREKVRRFLNASSTREIVFVRGATEAINLVAKSWGVQNVHEGDEIVVSHLEHHANIVPWQMLCAEKGARLRVVPVDNSGQILLDEYEKLLGPKTKLVAFAQVSNALGTVTPVQEMVAIAHRYGAKVLVDGAQAVSHMRVDVQAYDCDFYVLSGHKVFAPTGIGVVYGKEDVLQATPPWQGGGNMIVDVTFEKTVYHPAPFRFEAGTGSIADAVGLGAAIDYVERIGMENIARYEHDLLVYATEGLQRIPGLHLIGTAREKASVLSFVLDGFTNDEVGQALNKEGIAVRTGHHCAQPILRRFGVESTVRPSLAFYNTCEEIDALIAAIWNLKNGRGAGLI
ncbi:MAG: SufS family cysteine desulfurase [Acidobacteria bacterium]|nr:SufS family cysteine desulfurase [Acidobacteriota bacterium]